MTIGRKEITLFFYIYMALTVVSLVLDAGVVPASNGAFPYFVAAQNGLTSALCTCLLINGFVGFQLYEDGTRRSVWLLRGCSTLLFALSAGLSLLTFLGQGGVGGPQNTTGLFVVLFLLNAICLLVYVAMQVVLVANTLQDRWPLGHIASGVFFFVAGQLMVYVFGQQICEGALHYLDGLFFATICNLLAVMMVYKVGLHPLELVSSVDVVRPVLGLDHQRRPRIQRRCQAGPVGSERAPQRRRSPHNDVPR